MRRVLHFMADIQVSSGMAAVVMNYYRHIDRSRVQFDFYILRMVRYPMNRRSAPWAAGLSVFPVRAPSLWGISTLFSRTSRGIPDSPLSSHLVGRSFGTCCQALWRPSRLSAQPQ